MMSILLHTGKRRPVWNELVWEALAGVSENRTAWCVV